MPQLTNRKLVGEMTATPTGKGTVYSSMLKACSTNRERAARVNDSERQRLQKATNVIEKHNRHNQWRCDQEIEQVRQSLIKLEAFKRVLREEYPVKKILGKPTSRGKSITTKQNPAFSKNTTRSGGDSSLKDGKMSASLATSSSEEHCREEEVEAGNKLEPNIERDNIGSTKLKKQNEKEVKFRPGLESFPKEIVQNQRLYPDVIDIVKSANITTSHPSMPDGTPRQIDTDEKLLPIDKKTQLIDRDKSHDQSQARDTLPNSPLSSPNSETFEPTSESKRMLEQTSTGTSTSYSKSKMVRIPVKPFQATAETNLNSEKTTSPEHQYVSSGDTDAIGVPEVTREQLQKEERIQRLKAEWQKMMEGRVCNRGFDMNTLRVDIERKLKRMDIGRRHREIQKCLLEESMKTNNRIICTNKAKFDSVMETTRKKTL